MYEEFFVCVSGCCLVDSIIISQRLHDVKENQFIVIVGLKPDFKNTCKHVSSAEIVLNCISQSGANTPRKCDWELNYSCMYAPVPDQDWLKRYAHDRFSPRCL